MNTTERITIMLMFTGTIVMLALCMLGMRYVMSLGGIGMDKLPGGERAFFAGVALLSGITGQLIVSTYAENQRFFMKLGVLTAGSSFGALVTWVFLITLGIHLK